MIRSSRKPLSKRQVRRVVTAVALIIYISISFFFFSDKKIILPSEDAPLTIYSNQAGDNLRNTITTAIDSASESVYVAIFSLNDEAVISALRKKANEGKKVAVLCDSTATGPDIEWRLGTNVVVTRRHYKGLMHHKILIVDHKTIYFGSTNFTNDSFFKHGNILIGVESSGLSLALEQAQVAWIEKRTPDFSEVSIPTKEQQIDLYILPEAQDALPKLIKMINSAKKSVRVAMYTFTHEKLVTALADAHKRGCDVEVVFDAESSKRTSNIAFKKLQNEGVKVFTRRSKGLLHYKMMIQDDTILATGSANWTKAAFTKNDDNLVIIHPLTPPQRDKIQSIWNAIIRDSNRVPIQAAYLYPHKLYWAIDNQMLTLPLAS